MRILLSFGMILLSGCHRVGPTEAKVHPEIFQDALIKIEIDEINAGEDFRLIQISKRYLIVAKISIDPQLMDEAYCIEENGESTKLENIRIDRSTEGRWLRFSYLLPVSIVGKIVFNDKLGKEGGFMIAEPKSMDPGESKIYKYSILAYVNINKKRLIKNSYDLSTQEQRRSGMFSLFESLPKSQIIDDESVTWQNIKNSRR